MDEDLAHLDREADLWNLLPETSDPLPTVPDWPQFLRDCLKYRESLDRELPNAQRTDEEFQANEDLAS